MRHLSRVLSRCGVVRVVRVRRTSGSTITSTSSITLMGNSAMTLSAASTATLATLSTCSGCTLNTGTATGVSIGGWSGGGTIAVQASFTSITISGGSHSRSSASLCSALCRCSAVLTPACVSPQRQSAVPFR